MQTARIAGGRQFSFWGEIKYEITTGFSFPFLTSALKKTAILSKHEARIELHILHELFPPATPLFLLQVPVVEFDQLLAKD